ncbi:MAG: GNAT family N-acetyltransferase [Lachnospiraceae bacterium]|nr:GNAT family N-acetyltransferase [Lachnospiraceae bacterium]
MNNIQDLFEFRDIRPEEEDQAIEIEKICFPPNEACSPEHMAARVRKAPELFLVAEDKAAGRLAGFLNGLSTDEEVFRDEFFTDAELYDPAGKNVMLLGLDVLPEYRGRGLAKALVRIFLEREYKRRAASGKAILTCHEEKIEMYRKMGFKDLGISRSVWGGGVWHDMAAEYLASGEK